MSKLTTKLSSPSTPKLGRGFQTIDKFFKRRKEPESPQDDEPVRKKPLIQSEEQVPHSPSIKQLDSPNISRLPSTYSTPVKQLTTPAKQPINNLTPSRVSNSQSTSVNYSTSKSTPAKPHTNTFTPGKQPPNSNAGIDSDEIQHAHLGYKFLYPPHRYDINKRSPDHPDYDEKTLFVPDSFLDKQTPALRQWWLIKQRHMDAILFFKMGKFYELFNEDAVIAVNNLDIIYMKGDETKPAHAGFPEVSYAKYAKMLIDKGFKVIRIEQTETPAMMEERCIETGRKGKFDKVVKREVCRVTTKGTQMLGVMESVFHSAKNQYLLALLEDSNTDSTGPSSKIFGFCFVDITVSKLYIGQFEDDHNHSKLNILLAHHTPTEILYERANLSQLAFQAIQRTGAVLTSLKPNKEFWPIKKALSHLKVHNIFQNDRGEFEWPKFLTKLFGEGDESESIMSLEPIESYKYALHSFGAIVYYLQSQLIAGQVLNYISFEFYSTPFNEVREGDQAKLTPMIMDHIALANLEIFENSTGTSGATLFDSINYCKTHFGQRLLRNWLCSPLCDIEQINNRLDAVETLVNNNSASLMNEFTHVLGQTPDLERLLSKIKSQCFKSDSDARAIMFDGEQYSKAKINSFLNLLSNFKRLQKFVSQISSSMQDCKSHVLKRLLSFTTEGGLYPDYSETMRYFETAFDHDVALKTGKINPAQGVDSAYDTCQDNINNIKAALDDYLEEQKRVLHCHNIEYFGTAKNRFQIQVPEKYCKKVPDEYRIETTRKGFKRYYTPTIDKLFQKLSTYEEEMKRRLDGIMSKIFEQFLRQTSLWSAAIECVAVLDVLCSIASYVRSLKANNVDVCRPIVIENKGKPQLHYADGRHPALIKTNPDFISNNLEIDDRLVLLSGANMGGKSTLMRQSALMVILAQVGCFVPASKMHLTPVDRIFSRLGASDRLLEGESTFYTELVETSAMLRCATSNSLLLLDELGRGTSTYDGTAIAYSVLHEISDNIRCRCLFSTHYHTLVRDFQDSDQVRLAHMACKVEKETSDEYDTDPLKENITFLYKMTDGPVGRSYGFNVAKLAGISNEIISGAYEKAKELELASKALESLQKIAASEVGISINSELKERVLSTMVKG